MKLTAHQLGQSNTARRLVAASGGHYVKVVEAFKDVGLYRAEFPGIRIIGRRVTHADWSAESFVPTAAADNDFAVCLAEHRANPCDYWESGNEINASDYWQMRKIAVYDVRFMELCEAHGMKAVIGNFSTGEPGRRIEPISDAESILRYWAAYRPALERAAAQGHLVGVHEYLGAWSDDTWLQYRYRRLLGFCRASALKPPYLAITECGIDHWRGQISEQEYVECLVRYELGLRQDPEVVCACLFTSGTNGSDRWARHDIDGTLVPELMGAWAATNPETTAPPSVPSLQVGRRVRVRVGGLNLRPGPSTAGMPLTVLLEGSEFTVQAQSGQWIRVTRDGWINGSPAYVDAVG